MQYLGSKGNRMEMQAESKASVLNLRSLSFVLVAIGLFVSGYLSYTHLAGVSTACIEGGGFNCDTVATSVYSTLLGIPVAYLGFATYVFIGAILVLQTRVGILIEYGNVILFAVTLFGFLFSVWLVYVQVVLIEALCIWCLVHEVNITILMVVTGIRIWGDLRASRA
jgi:uncharacterized membrane protein